MAYGQMPGRPTGSSPQRADSSQKAERAGQEVQVGRRLRVLESQPLPGPDSFRPDPEPSLGVPVEIGFLRLELAQAAAPIFSDCQESEVLPG